MLIAVSFSKSNFTPAVFIAVLDSNNGMSEFTVSSNNGMSESTVSSNNGMSESTVSVFIVTSFPAMIAGKLYSALDFRRVPPPN